MISLDIHPFEGAAPIRFGMLRDQVLELLGMPRVVSKGVDAWGVGLAIQVGYDREGGVDGVGLGPGDYELKLDGQLIWAPNEHPDPNPVLLARDREPVECLGFLVFTNLGVATSGYHDNDPYQLAVQVYRKGQWDKQLRKAKSPVLDKYIRHDL